jgi:hypothetical protein
VISGFVSLVSVFVSCGEIVIWVETTTTICVCSVFCFLRGVFYGWGLRACAATGWGVWVYPPDQRDVENMEKLLGGCFPVLERVFGGGG